MIRRTARARAVLAILASAAALLVVANTAPAASAPDLHPLAASGGYHAVFPSRVLDTRVGIGAPIAKVGPGASIDVLVNSTSTMPASGVIAVVLNVTATNPTTGGFLTVYPTGEAVPDASAVNFGAGDSVPNLVTVKLGTGGRVSIFNALGETDLIADVVGWYDDGTTPTAGGWFNPLTPARILDTRPGDPIGERKTIDLKVTGVGGVPESGVSAVAVNVTATNATAASYLVVHRKAPGFPLTSNVNFVPGRDVANLAIVDVDPATGMISIKNERGTVDVVVDVVGWYDTAGTTGSVFRPVSPTRILNTRGIGMGAGFTYLYSLPGRGPIPISGATAVVMNVTATDQTYGGFLTIWPDDQPRPDTSTINWEANRTVANLTMQRLPSTPGYLTGVHLAPTQFGLMNLLLDVTGYFVAGS
jgi:hypothetical protein